MEAVLAEHREAERNLRNTLLTAQRLADDIKANAEEEARRILQDAEGRSDLLLQQTQARLEDVQREIDGLRLKRKDVETSIEANIATLHNTLEFVRERIALCGGGRRTTRRFGYAPRLACASDPAEER